MYVYLYDSLLKARQYDRVLSALETKLIDLGISGKTVRLSSLLSPKQIISDETRRNKEVRTVVVVGDDSSFTKIVQQAADAPVTFGWVPIGPQTNLAERLGLPYGAACAQVLSRRRVAAIDIGQVNQFFFIDSCRIPLSNITMSLNGSITISGTAQQMQCDVWNMVPADRALLPPGYEPSPHDKQLEMVLQPVAKKRLFGSTLASASIFPFTEARLKFEKTVTVTVDGRTFKENQMVIRLAPSPLKLIVSRLTNPAGR